MEILKQHSQKQGYQGLSEKHPDMLAEVQQAIQMLDAVTCLTKVSRETSKIERWGGLLFSPVSLNHYFTTHLLQPKGWVEWDDEKGKYVEPALFFPNVETPNRNDRFRKMDGIKHRVGLEVQFGKYAFMGYDIFSKMIIFKNADLIDFGIEIVPVQQMVSCMSTGISAFEAIMIDFEHRGEADIDVPVVVWGIGPTEDEWQRVFELQQLFREDSEAARKLNPAIGQSDRQGTTPGPK